MPKVPRDKESAAPKKTTRKATTKPTNGVHADGGNGASTQAVTVSPKVPKGSKISEVVIETIEAEVTPSQEERIRIRAYELYLERGGHGGSPEQDWHRAKTEVSGHNSGHKGTVQSLRTN
jgi:hypothetical protein